MAKFVITDASVVLTVGATPYDLSDHLESVTVDAKKDTPETNAMGPSWRERLGGLKDYSITLNMHNDFAAGSVDAAIYAAFNATTNPTIVIKPTSAAVSATNPSFSGAVICPAYTPLSGNVGDVSKQNVTLQGSGALTRATA